MAAAQGIRAGRAYVQMGLDDTLLQKGLKQVEARLKAFGSSISGIGAALAGAGIGITTPLIAAAKSFADIGSVFADMSARTGVSVEALSAFGFAAAQTGTDLGAVEIGIRKMQKALVAGSEENVTAAATFQALGLSVDRLMGMKPEDQFTAIAGAINGIENPTAKAAAAMSIFGKSGTQLLPMISNLGALTGQAKEFGLVWTGEEAEKADALGDAIDLVTAVAGRAVSVIGGALAPIFTNLAGSIANVTKTALDWVKANQGLITVAFQVGAGLVVVGGALVALGAILSGVGSALGVLASGLGLLSGLFTALISPIGLVIVGITAGAAAFLMFTDAGQQMVSLLSGGFAELLAIAQQTFGGIANALKAGDIRLAAEVLWAGLKVTWLTGLNALSALWADWSVATIEVFRGMSFRLADALTSGWASIQVGFLNMTTGLASAWAAVMTFLQVSWERIKGLFTGSDAESEIAQIQARATAATAERQAAYQQERADIETTRDARLQALSDQQAAEVDARRKAAAEGLAAGQKELADAKARLAELTEQSQMEATTVVEPAKKPAVPLPTDLEGLGEAMSQAKAKVDVAGSFSAAALRGLGAGESVQNEQLTEQKKHTALLEKIDKKAGKKEATFI